MIIKLCLLMLAVSTILGVHASASDFIVATKTPSPAILELDDGGAIKSTTVLRLPALDISLDELGLVHYVNGTTLSKILADGKEEIVVAAPSGIHWEAIVRIPGKGWVIGDTGSHSIWMVDDISHSIRRLGYYAGDQEDYGIILGLNLLDSEKIILLHVGPLGIPSVSIIDLDGVVTEMPLSGEVLKKRLARRSLTTKVNEKSSLATTGGRLVIDRKQGRYLFADDWAKSSISIFGLSKVGSITTLFNVDYERKMQSTVAISAIAVDGDSLVVAAYGCLRRYSMNGKLLQQLSKNDAFWQSTAIITR